MKKRFTTLVLALLILIAASNICFADTDEVIADEQNEIIREEIEYERPSITPREATISMLLNAGWTMEEIDEWYTEEDLKELDENAKAISYSAKYIVGYESTETEEIITEELTRQQFEYGLNRAHCEEDGHDSTDLSTVSSNGVLELQPIYGWSDMDYVTANDRIYFGYESGGYSGASIWNADSECYLKQNMGLIWMANDTYGVQYRYEWMSEPTFKITDHFGVALATDLIVHENSRETFTFKYNLRGTDYTEIITIGSHTSSYQTNWCTLRNIGGGARKTVKNRLAIVSERNIWNKFKRIFNLLC